MFACVALSREPWQLALSMLLIGFQLGNTGIMLGAIRDVVPRRRIGTVIAVFGASGPIGFAVGPALGGFLVDGLGWPLSSIFWVSAGLSIATAALVWFGSTRGPAAGRPGRSRPAARLRRAARRARRPGGPADLRDLRRRLPGQPDEPAVPGADRRVDRRAAGPGSRRRSGSWPAPRPSSAR